MWLTLPTSRGGRHGGAGELGAQAFFWMQQEGHALELEQRSCLTEKGTVG